HASPVTTRPRPPQTPTSSASAAAASATVTPKGSASPGAAARGTPGQAVYFFGNGKAEGTRDMKKVLGGKGANLAEMTNLGIPVPPGFTIACDVCIHYLKQGKAPDSLRPQVDAALERLEE